MHSIHLPTSALVRGGLTSLLAFSLAAPVSTAMPAPGEAADYARFFPQDTFMFMAAPDVPRMRENFDQHYGTLVDLEKLRQFLRPLEEQLAEDPDFKEDMGLLYSDFEETGLLGPFVEVLDSAKGEAAMGFYASIELFEILEAEEKPEEIPAGMLVFAEIDETSAEALDERWEAITASILEEQESDPDPIFTTEFIEDDYEGYTLNLAVRIDDDEDKRIEVGGYAVIENHLVIGVPGLSLREAVERVVEADSDSARSLNANPRYTDTLVQLEALEETDMLFFFDANYGMKMLNEILLIEERKEAELRAEYGDEYSSEPEMRPGEVMELLGVNDWSSAFAGWGTRSGLPGSVSGLLVEEKTGLFELLKFPELSFEPLPFAPQNTVTYFHLGLDFDNLWTVLRQKIREQMPDGGQQFDQGLDMVAAVSGISVPRLFQDGFGEEFVLLYLEKDGPVLDMTSPFSVGMFDMVLAFELRDRQTIEMAISNGLAASGVPPQMLGSRNYLDTEFNYVPGPDIEAPQRFSWFIRDEWLVLVIGSLENTEGVIAQMASDRPGKLDARFQTLADEHLPREGFNASFDDIAVTFDSMFSMFTAMPGGDEMPVDFSAFEDAGDFPYYRVGRGFETEDGYIFHDVLLPRDGLEQ
ncbi:MAG: hypothetical protein ACFBZ8_00135 [Opitutales bacterium]